MFKMRHGLCSFRIGNLIISFGISESHYCENRSISFPGETVHRFATVECVNCEVAVFAADNETWKTKEVFMEAFGEEIFDDVYGYCDEEKFNKLLKFLIEKAGI